MKKLIISSIIAGGSVLTATAVIKRKEIKSKAEELFSKAFGKKEVEVKEASIKEETSTKKKKKKNKKNKAQHEPLEKQPYVEFKIISFSDSEIVEMKRKITKEFGVHATNSQIKQIINNGFIVIKGNRYDINIVEEEIVEEVVEEENSNSSEEVVTSKEEEKVS